jgi:bifunctional DNA-binding transcriptional regulator/antitoxin component of YhaV-PrlF toxin-antitoxin module
MIQSIQKVIAIGSSKGVTLPTKAAQRDNIKLGDEVEIIVRPVRHAVSKDDQAVLDAAKKILKDYKQDFQNLAKR